jgi:hypothetical protein
VGPGVDAGAAREDHAAKNRVTHAATIGGTTSVNVPYRLFGISLVLSANSPAQVTLLYPSQICFPTTAGSRSTPENRRRAPRTRDDVAPDRNERGSNLRDGGWSCGSGARQPANGSQNTSCDLVAVDCVSCGDSKNAPVSQVLPTSRTEELSRFGLTW